MKIFTAVLVAACFSMPMVIGQEAKIMIVEKSDSQRLLRAYREFKDARSRWEDAKSDVAKQYTMEKGKFISGWEKVQFSADFRAIVPDQSQYAAHSYWGSGNCFTTTLTNASGTSTATGIDATSSIYPNGLDFSVNPALTTTEKK